MSDEFQRLRKVTLFLLANTRHVVRVPPIAPFGNGFAWYAGIA